MNQLIQHLSKKKKSLAVVGLGYVGLPLALEFAKKYKVIGFDVNKNRIIELKRGVDHTGEALASSFKKIDITFTNDPKSLTKAKFIIVCVPTPIDKTRRPNLAPMVTATEIVAAAMTKGTIVVFESTVYPGVTEEICVPILERISKLKAGVDFKVGYSPERINPGDRKHTLTTIKKVVSGMDEKSTKLIAKVYESVIKAGVHIAPTIKTAEAAKVIENTQRDLNIALMNELAIIFNKLGIRTRDVLEAAGTKWNFLKFYPGLVGGHTYNNKFSFGQ